MSDDTERDDAEDTCEFLEDQLDEALATETEEGSEESGVDDDVSGSAEAEAENIDTTPEEGEEIDVSYKEIAPNPEADQLNLIRQIEYEVDAAESDWEDAKANAKECKETYERKVKQLREAVRGITGRLPLFEQSRDGTPREVTNAKIENDDTYAVDEPWRDIDLDELGIPESIRRCLVEAGITTIGGITDWTSADKRLTDIKGIGEAKADKIQECLVQYWADHPQITPETSEGEPEETTGEYSQEFLDGYAAHRDGVPSMSNPWDADTHTAERADWNAGWNKGMQDASE